MTSIIYIDGPNTKLSRSTFLSQNQVNDLFIEIKPTYDKLLMSKSEEHSNASFKTIFAYVRAVVFKWQALKHFLVVHSLKAHIRNLNFDI